MSAPSHSVRVVVIALLANLGIAVSKFVGAFFTGSASLLAEAIHSVADCTNQVFLLIGSKKSQKPPDELHPLGYGRESFFWSFLVALLLFSMGGVFAVYEGIHKVQEASHELQYPYVALTILIVAVLLEGGSFFACLKEVQKRKKPHESFWSWFRDSTTSDLLVIFLEDLAALTGLIVATLFLALSIATNDNRYDAMGSIFIGVLLIVMSFLLAREVKSLIVGEKSSKDYKNSIEELFKRTHSEFKVLKLISLVTGSDEIMITLKLHPGHITNSKDLIDAINRVEKQIRSLHPEIKWLFVEPDFVD